jgi:anti-anti-sigma factor
MVLVNATNDDIVVDCAGLEFIDSSGIHVFLGVQELLEAQGREFRIENLSGTPRRAFELLGLFDCVDIGEPEPA